VCEGVNVWSPSLTNREAALDQEVDAGSLDRIIHGEGKGGDVMLLRGKKAQPQLTLSKYHSPRYSINDALSESTLEYRGSSRHHHDRRKV